MITKVSVAGHERSFSEADPGWINQQINPRRGNSEPVCVRVTFRTASGEWSLASRSCPRMGGGYFDPQDRLEKAIIELWRQERLDTDGFNGGDLNNFIKRVERMI